MHAIIDVPSNVGSFATRLVAAGVKTVIRYYNHRNGTALPSKGITRDELGELHDAGLAVAVVFQQRGGAGGNIEDLDAQSGADDAARALELAAEMRQPQGSTIYFAVDWDYFRQSDLSQLAQYFDRVKQALDGMYLVGVYGSGTVGKHLKSRSLVDHIWLAGATGWSGTQAALEEGNWSLFQKYLHKTSEIGGFGYDGNVANPALGDYGQFAVEAIRPSLRGEGVAAIYRVIARPDLNLRAGPGENYRVLQTVPRGELVTGLAADGEWMKVDLEGDGDVDGYMFRQFLEAVSGGVPEPPIAGQRAPYDIAKIEQDLDVREVPGDRNNPRIVMYHATAGGAAADEVAWCSSFVNYCVEQAGMRGTDSKWAMSWHESDWGRDVTAAPVEGDIVVFRRRDGSAQGAILGGHVAFLVEDLGDGFRVLGGNQSNRIKISRYPKNGRLGDFHYKLLSIRRG